METVALKNALNLSSLSHKVKKNTVNYSDDYEQIDKVQRELSRCSLDTICAFWNC